MGIMVNKWTDSGELINGWMDEGRWRFDREVKLHSRHCMTARRGVTGLHAWWTRSSWKPSHIAICTLTVIVPWTHIYKLLIAQCVILNASIVVVNFYEWGLKIMNS